jgi:O-succinylbenzoate synthase
MVLSALLVLFSATLGCRNPLSVALTSNFAEASGVVVPMPTWAKNKLGNMSSAINVVFVFIFINIKK